KDDQACVRIAILDTGVDATHPQIRDALAARRIVASFPESVGQPSASVFNPLVDQHGHGTHGTSVLLRTAPNAAIYIARVADDDGTLRYDSIVKVHSFNH